MVAKTEGKDEEFEIKTNLLFDTLHVHTDF